MQVPPGVFLQVRENARAEYRDRFGSMELLGGSEVDALEVWCYERWEAGSVVRCIGGVGDPYEFALPPRRILAVSDVA